MTPSDTGWRMNSDTWLPTAPERAMQTKQPVGIASALRTHTNRTRIEGERAVNDLLLAVVHVVLLEFAVQRGLANAEHAGRGKLITPGFAQGRQFDLDDIQTEIQILPDSSRTNGRVQIAVSGSDDTDIDLAAFGGADGLDFALLQRAQELGLQIHGHVSDFIEKERAPLGGFEQTLLGLHGPGERALDVAEQLGFDQRGDQRRTVHRRKGVVFARPRKMNAAGHEFFPRSALPQDENGILMLAHFFDNFVDALHFHGNADQPAEPRPRAQLLAQQAVLLLEFHRAPHAFEAGAQLLNAARLGAVIDGAKTRNLPRGFNGSILREHEDGNF